MRQKSDPSPVAAEKLVRDIRLGEAIFSLRGIVLDILRGVGANAASYLLSHEERHATLSR